MLARREQENFQLVVITHDEAFAKHIGTREHAEFMWRIVKDENQHSTVMKEDIWE
jgi:DNA repair protein RAD50